MISMIISKTSTFKNLDWKIFHASSDPQKLFLWNQAIYEKAENIMDIYYFNKAYSHKIEGKSVFDFYQKNLIDFIGTDTFYVFMAKKSNDYKKNSSSFDFIFENLMLNLHKNSDEKIIKGLDRLLNVDVLKNNHALLLSYFKNQDSKKILLEKLDKFTPTNLFNFLHYIHEQKTNHDEKYVTHDDFMYVVNLLYKKNKKTYNLYDKDNMRLLKSKWLDAHQKEKVFKAIWKNFSLDKYSCEITGTLLKEGIINSSNYQDKIFFLKENLVQFPNLLLHQKDFLLSLKKEIQQDVIQGKTDLLKKINISDVLFLSDGLNLEESYDFYKNIFKVMAKNESSLSNLIYQQAKNPLMNHENFVDILFNIYEETTIYYEKSFILNYCLKDFVEYHKISDKSIIEACLMHHQYNMNNTDVYLNHLGVFKTLEKIAQSKYIVNMQSQNMFIYDNDLLNNQIGKFLDNFSNSTGNINYLGESFDLEKNPEGPILKIFKENSYKRIFPTLVKLYNAMPKEIQNLTVDNKTFVQHTKKDMPFVVQTSKSFQSFWSLNRWLKIKSIKELEIAANGDIALYFDKKEKRNQIKIENIQKVKFDFEDVLSVLKKAELYIKESSQKNTLNQFKEEINFFEKVFEKYYKVSHLADHETKFFFETKFKNNFKETLQIFVHDLQNHEMANLLEKTEWKNEQMYQKTLGIMHTQLIEVTKEMVKKINDSHIQHHQVTQIYLQNQLTPEAVPINQETVHQAHDSIQHEEQFKKEMEEKEYEEEKMSIESLDMEKKKIMKMYFKG